jgi:hypothetical protein
MYGNEGMAAAPKPKLDPYANHAQAVALWHQRCREYQQAAEMKAQAKDGLESAIQILAAYLAEAVCDPTVPRDPTAAPNGGLGAQAQQRRPGF